VVQEQGIWVQGKDRVQREVAVQRRDEVRGVKSFNNACFTVPFTSSRLGTRASYWLPECMSSSTEFFRISFY